MEASLLVTSSVIGYASFTDSSIRVYVCSSVVVVISSTSAYSVVSASVFVMVFTSY